MVWKEWRENWRWALLASVLLLAALIVAASSVIDPRNQGSVLVFDSSAVQWVTAVGFAAVAFMLGVRQVLGDVARRDAWAFLVQRPLSLSRIFWAKALVGLGLYLLATTLPFGMLVWWVATPGHVPAPFYAPMTFPAIADLVGGLPYYFVGSLVASREARWYASRWWPLGLPVASSLVIVRVAGFSTALLVALVVTSVTAAAAWLSFSRRRAPLARILVGQALLLGLSAFAVALLAFLYECRVTDSATRADDQVFYGVSRDGHIVKTVDENGRRVAYDLDDHGRSVGGDEQAAWMQRLPMVFLPLTSAFPYRPRYRTEAAVNALHDWRWDSFGPRMRWYYSYVERVLLGYDTETRRLVSRGGRTGFRGTEEHVEPFVGSPTEVSAQVLVFPSTVYQVDLRTRRLDAIATTAPNETFLGAHQQDSLVGVTTERNVLLLSSVSGDSPPWPGDLLHQGPLTLLATIPIPPELQHDEQADIDAHRWFEICQIGWLPVRNTCVFVTERWILEVNPAGEIVRRFAIPAQTSEAEERTPSRLLSLDVLMMAFPGCAYLLSGDLEWKSGGFSFLIIGVAYAMVASVMATWYGAGQSRWLWAILAIPFGLIAVLAFLASHERYVREPCSHCGKPLLVTQTTCARCGQARSPMARDGTEILISP
jgi:hypothetical protein